MTKMTRNSIIAAGVIVLLIVGIIVISNIDTADNNESATEEDVYTIYSEDVNNISSVNIARNENTLTASKNNSGEWTVNNMDTDDVDTSKVYNMVAAAASLTSKNKISPDSSDLAQYGLDTPVTVTITKENGDSDIINIGSKSPTLGEYFVMKDGDSTIYTIQEFKVNIITKPIEYYQEFDRFNVNIDDINNIKIVRSDETIELKIIDNIDKNSNNVWEMISPYRSGANDDYIDNKILEPIANLELNTPAKDTDGGITDKSPELNITVRPYDNDTGIYGSEYTEIIKIGVSDGDRTYVQYKGKLYSVPNNSVSFVNENSYNIVSKLQALVDISKVNSVTLEYSGEYHTMEIEHIDDKQSFKIDGADADENLSRTMYRGIIALAVDSVYNGETMGNVVFKISYDGIKQEDDTVVEFRQIDDLNCALTRNGVTEFTIKKSKIDELVDTFKKYLSNPQ